MSDQTGPICCSTLKRSGDVTCGMKTCKSGIARSFSPLLGSPASRRLDNPRGRISAIPYTCMAIADDPALGHQRRMSAETWCRAQKCQGFRLDIWALPCRNRCDRCEGRTVCLVLDEALLAAVAGVGHRVVVHVQARLDASFPNLNSHTVEARVRGCRPLRANAMSAQTPC